MKSRKMHLSKKIFKTQGSEKTLTSELNSSVRPSFVRASTTSLRILAMRYIFLCTSARCSVLHNPIWFIIISTSSTTFEIFMHDASVQIKCAVDEIFPETRTLLSPHHRNHYADVYCPHTQVARCDSVPCNDGRILVIFGHHDFDQSSLLPFWNAFAA